MAAMQSAMLPWYARNWAWGLGCLALLAAGLAMGFAVRPTGRPAMDAAMEAKGLDELKLLLEISEARIQGLRDRLARIPEAVAACNFPPPVPASETKGSQAPALPSAEDDAVPLSVSQLRERLNRATVLVLSGRGSGSGFFITPGLVVTNAHVVDRQDPTSLRIANRWMNGVIPAELVAITAGSGVGAPDYALLRAHPPVPAEPLPLVKAVGELDPVVAAGFPGLYLDTWSGNGGEGLPPLFFRRGEIVYQQEMQAGSPVLSHTAEIFPGNSGGPLVDGCGGVVGINTFGLTLPSNEHTAGAPVKIDFALSALSLVQFLEGHGVQPSIRAQGCSAAPRSQHYTSGVRH